MILAMVYLIGHLHFINFNQKHLQAIFYRIHFLHFTLISIANSSHFEGNPYCYPMVREFINLFVFLFLTPSLPISFSFFFHFFLRDFLLFLVFFLFFHLVRVSFSKLDYFM